MSPPPTHHSYPYHYLPLRLQSRGREEAGDPPPPPPGSWGASFTIGTCAASSPPSSPPPAAWKTLGEPDGECEECAAIIVQTIQTWTATTTVQRLRIPFGEGCSAPSVRPEMIVWFCVYRVTHREWLRVRVRVTAGRCESNVQLGLPIDCFASAEFTLIHSWYLLLFGLYVIYGCRSSSGSGASSSRERRWDSHVWFIYFSSILTDRF